jgi:hypothetical protein
MRAFAQSISAPECRASVAFRHVQSGPEAIRLTVIPCFRLRSDLSYIVQTKW